MYKLLNSNAAINLTNNASFPFAPGNKDYIEYQEWIALGNTPQPADPPPPPDENQIAQTGVKTWFEAHPSAGLLFNLSIADLDIEIDAMCDALFPAPITATNRNKMKLWMKTVSHSARALSKREGFTT